MDKEDRRAINFLTAGVVIGVLFLGGLLIVFKGTLFSQPTIELVRFQEDTNNLFIINYKTEELEFSRLYCYVSPQEGN